jgi:Probable Zinc-ribbon domain
MRAIAGETDLATTHPDLAVQAHGFDPTTVKAHSNKSTEWICERGHVWSATPNNRSKGTGCPICLGRQVLVGYNDLASLHPDVSRDAAAGTPRR